MSAGRDKKARTKERREQLERSLVKRKAVKVGQAARRKVKRLARYEMRVNDPLRRKRISPPYQ